MPEYDDEIARLGILAATDAWSLIPLDGGLGELAIAYQKLNSYQLAQIVDFWQNARGELLKSLSEGDKARADAQRKLTAASILVVIAAREEGLDWATLQSGIEPRGKSIGLTLHVAKEMKLTAALGCDGNPVVPFDDDPRLRIVAGEVRRRTSASDGEAIRRAIGVADQLKIATAARMATELPDLKPYHVKAAKCYEHALRNGPGFDESSPLNQLHAWLKENLPEEGYELAGGADTWGKYIREYRKVFGQSINTPKAGRGHGSSIVESDQV